MQRLNWSEAYQRGVIYALITGKLHIKSDGIKDSWFSGLPKLLINSALVIKRESGEWPDFLTLRESAATMANGEGGEIAAEVERTRETTATFLSYVVRTAPPQLKRVALEQASIQLSEIADGEPEHFGRARELIDEALRAGEKPALAFRFEVGVVERHRPDRGSTGFLIAPTGIPSLDLTLEGGLRGGELGLIYGYTGLGKTHFVCSFGAHTLRSGGKVLHITCELSDLLTARRYDRCLTGLTTEEIRTGPDTYMRAWKESCNPESLKVYGFPRYSLSPSGVTDLLKRAMDRWQDRCLVIVDYGSILRPDHADSRHQEVGKIHESLSRLAQEHQVPVWTPFQTNRQVFFNNDSGETRLEHAGESYEAFQHADIILALSQSRQDEQNKHIRLKSVKMREASKMSCIVEVDWSRTQIREKSVDSQEQVSTLHVGQSTKGE